MCKRQNESMGVSWSSSEHSSCSCFYSKGHANSSLPIPQWHHRASTRPYLIYCYTCIREFHNSQEVEMGLLGTLDIPRDCIAGGRTSLHSDTRDHSPDDGKCFRVLVMCKTHVEASFKTVMDAAPISLLQRRNWDSFWREGSSRTRQNKRGKRISRQQCWWSQLGVGHNCSLPDSR